MKNNEVNKLRRLVSDDTWDLFVECDVLIAGGAITSIFTNKEVNDVDVYFKTPESMLAFICAVYSESLKDDEDLSNLLSSIAPDHKHFAVRFQNLTDKSLLGVDNETTQYVQLITYKTFKTAEDIFADFDFTCCMGAYSPKDEKFYLHDDFLKHNAQKYLQVNTGTLYPLITALRVKKYADKGYSISKAQMLRILLKISEMNITNWLELKEQIGGMYGLNMDTVFDETKAFNMEDALETLDALESDNKFEIMHGRSIPFSEIQKKLSHIFGKIELPPDNRISASGRYFKNVKESDGKLISYYQPSFEYKLGTITDGGPNGVYVYDGYDVISGMYSGYNDCKIIEIVPILNETKVERMKDMENPVKLQAFGKCYVSPVSYSLAEFKRTFNNRRKYDEESN